jgi:formamidopyrimidine-DNA glycosylase
MPELPEVETVRLQLLYKVLNKPIFKVKVFNPKTVADNAKFPSVLKGKSFNHVDRIGKLLIFCFAGEQNLFILTHLKMTGQFFYQEKNNVHGGGHTMSESDSRNLPNKHTRVAIYFADDSALFFNDMRKFGYMHLADASEVARAKGRFGQELIDPNFDTENFFNSILKRKTSIKATLLDQTFVAGLGNIYVDEALYIAKVRPDRVTNLVTKKEALAIAKASNTVMSKSIEVGGTTFQSFADTNGHIGNYKSYLQVFGKQNTPCPKCKTLIVKTRVAGRGTHFCPTCQK